MTQSTSVAFSFRFLFLLRLIQWLCCFLFQMRRKKNRLKVRNKYEEITYGKSKKSLVGFNSFVFYYDKKLLII